MSDTLIGVIVGGLIAWVAPLMTLRYSERRWKFEASLSSLKADRQRIEQLYEKNLQLFGEGAIADSYSSNMMTDVLVLMPKEIGDIFLAYMDDKDKTDIKKKHTYFELASAMKRDLKSRDNELEKFLKQ